MRLSHIVVIIIPCFSRTGSPASGSRAVGPRVLIQTGARVTKHKVALLTREYPSEVYGGAGVHVEYLSARAAPAHGAIGPLLGLAERRSGRDRTSPGRVPLSSLCRLRGGRPCRSVANSSVSICGLNGCARREPCRECEERSCRGVTGIPRVSAAERRRHAS